MARDLFAEAGIAPPKKQAQGRDLFAEAGIKPDPQAQERAQQVVEARQKADRQIADAEQDDGFLDRAGSLLQQGLGWMEAGADRTASALQEWSSNNPLPWTSEENIQKERTTAQFRRSLARERERVQGTEVAGTQSWEDLKANPSVGGLGQFVVEQGIASLPQMGAAAVALPALVASQTGNIAQQRAENNGETDADIRDVGIALPFAAASSALERVGIKGIAMPKGRNAGTRIASAAGKEAGTEFVQSGLENAGGTLGTDRGFDVAEALDESLAGAVAGAGIGGGLRGGAEIIDTSGRIIRRRRDDNRTPASGQVEQAAEAAAVPTQADIDSPLDTADIAEGSVAIATAQAEHSVTRTLEAAGLPGVGERVVVQDPVLGPRSGVMRDRFSGEDGSGVIIELDGGRVLREYDDTLADAGITITADTPLSEADALDQQLAGRARSTIDSAIAGDIAATAAAPSPAAPMQQAGTPITTPQGAVTSGPANPSRGYDLQAVKNAIRGPESSGNDRAVNQAGSSASGRYQFIGSTFRGLYRKVYGASKAQAAKAWANNRFDVGVQEKLMDQLVSDNAAAIRKAGFTPDAGTLYLAHFAGSNAAVKLLRADPSAPVSKYFSAEAIAQNSTYLGGGKTVGQALSIIRGKVGEKGGATIGASASPIEIASGTDRPSYREQNNDRAIDGLTEQPAAATIENVRREPIAVRSQGKKDVAVTVTGREVPVEYAVAELSDLTASNTLDGAVNPNYPASRQPRDRSRAASLSQIENIAGNLNPRLLGPTAKASDGAPIVSPDGVVESGNGRTMALQKVYETGSDKAQAYRSYIEEQGFNTEGMTAPVLVRVRDGAMAEEDVQAFVREANARDTAGMSGTETAASDAGALDGALLGMYRGGDVDSAGNRDFVRAFNNALVPENERASLVLKDGTIAVALKKRIEAALLVRAVGNRSFIESVVDSDADNIKAISKALIDVAGPLSQLRQGIADGNIDPSMDVSENIAEAVEIVERARREKRNLSDLINQRDVFSGEAVAPLTEAVLHLFFNGPRFSRPAGKDRIVERLGFYIAQAEQATPGGGLFGEDVAQATPDEILALSTQKGQTVPDGQADLLQTTPAAGQGSSDAGNVEGVQQDGRDSPERAGEGALPQSGSESQSESVAAPATGPSSTASQSEQATVTDTTSGKGVAVKNASAAQIAAIEKAVPKARGVKRGDGAIVYSKKHEKAIRDALVKQDAPTAGADLRGADLRKGWVYFTGASGSLGIPRAEMPQIAAENRGAMVNFLAARGITHTEETVPARDLLPTQAEFSPEKVAAAKTYTGGNRAILVASDNYVVDGHHQWLASRDAGEDIRIIRLAAPIRDVLSAVAEMPSTTSEGNTSAPAGPRVMVNKVGRDALEQEQRDIYGQALDGTDFSSLSNAPMSASGNVRSNQSREPSSSGAASSGARENSSDLSASPVAEHQAPSSQTNATPSAPDTAMQTGRPSISPKAGDELSISDNVSTDGSQSNNEPSANRLVTDERAAELRKRLREKLNPNRLNAGIDPEVLAIGTELAVYHIEKGARRFKAFSTAIAQDLGMELADLRRYLRGWYNGARDMMEDSGESVAGMDDADEAGRAMRTFAEWANSTQPENRANQAGDADVQTRLSAGDERPGTQDGEGTSQDRRATSASGQEGGGSPATLFDADSEGGDGRGQQRSSGSTSGTTGDRTGVRNDDGVPATERDAGTGSRPARATPKDIKGTDWLIEPGSLAEERGPAQKARDNIAAIETVKRLTAEGRMATREEQAQIAQYVGWGGLANAFPDPRTGDFGKGFETVGPRLRELLTDEEYETARRSIQYAHYTGETVVRAMWDMAHRLGFRGGQVFEPGMGTGNFRGMMRPDLLAATRYSGLEYDHLTADIAKLLYPQSGVRQADYTQIPGMKDAVDLVIGNPPFSDTAISTDKELGTYKFMLHDFFFAKSIEAVKPGGLLMFVTSAGTMNKVNSKARDFMADRADLVGAIRLPNNAFQKNAGTKVTTDIVILRKREPGAAAADRSWTEVQAVKMLDRDGAAVEGNVNRYFVENPDMILGEQGMFDQLVSGPRYAVRAPAGFDFEAAIAKAIDALPVAEATTAPKAQSKAAAEFDLQSDERKDGSFYFSDSGALMQFKGGVGVEVKPLTKGEKGGLSKGNLARVKKLVPVKNALREVFAADLSENEADAAAARKKLAKAYDAFTKEFGPINLTTSSASKPTAVQIEKARSEAREEARLGGAEWDEGSFDIQPLLDEGATDTAISKARAAAKAKAITDGRTWDEGSFDPDEVPDNVNEKRPNLQAFLDDEEGYRLAAIENYDKDSGKAKKGRIFTQSSVRLDKEPEINGVQDALFYSLNRLGRPDIGLIADKAGKSPDDVLAELSGRVFEVPGTPGTYETSEVYLSGNVREKLATAQDEAKRNPAFAPNVRALEAVQPAPLTPSEIHAKLGMLWIPNEVVEQFATEKLGLARANVRYVAVTADWVVTGDSTSAAATADWGTKRLNAIKLLEMALGRQTPKVYDYTSDGKRVFNEVDTQAAQDKQEAIKDAFTDWIWSDDTRTAELVDRYNVENNSLVAPDFDGSYLTTPGINPLWKWRPHQSSVIARIIQTGNTYMAHEVGSGKTSAMIGAGMEMRRLGMVNKPMYVVPNHMLGQFTKEFYEQYPLAKIRVADEKRFHTSRRKEFVAAIATDDLDAVIITHSAFKYISISDEFSEKMLQDAIGELEAVLAETDSTDRITRKSVENQKEKLEQRMKSAKGRKDQVFTFEETGVDFLFVDEAHLFRKLDYATKLGDVKGIDPKGSQASFDLFAKTRYLETKAPGRNLVLASGTPITNTMAELFSVSRYLQETELNKRGLAQFDAWAAAFGDTVTALEQDPAGGYKPQTRFSKFVNTPELSVMVRQVMDVVSEAQLQKFVTLPKLKGGERQMVLADKTPLQEDYQAVLKDRMQTIENRSGPPKKGDDIILSVIGDGRKAAIDYRLISPLAKREAGSKLEQTIDNVFERWEAFKDVTFHEPLAPGEGYSKDVAFRGAATQMIFCDFGINGEFPVHKYIKQSLIRMGIPARQVALIADFKTHVAKQRLFNDMNEGKVRVLIGSVAKMGTGVNAQRRLRAVHNMDAQWYPANDTQRNGRIKRQGNMNPEIEIIDYSTKGTYDSQMWNLMAKKGKFIEGFMRGDPTMRDMEDLGEANMYEQAQALTTSDPRIMDLTQWKQDVDKLQRQKAAKEREQQSLRRDIAYSEDNLAAAQAIVPLIEQDITARNLPEKDTFAGTIEGKAFTERVPFGEAVQEVVADLVVTANGKRANRTIGEFAGFTLEGASAPGIDGPRREVRIMRAGKRQSVIQVSDDPSGVVTRLTNALGKFERELEEEQNVIATAQRKIADATPRLGQAFDDGGKLTELRGKITALEATLAKESADRKKARETKDSIPEEDLFNPAQPERTMTQRQRAELEARQKQGMARRGGQEGLGDQEGGLFANERDQGALFRLPDGEPATNRDLKDFEKAANERLRAMGIDKRVQLRVTTRAGMAGSGSVRLAPDGRYHPSMKLIEVASDATQNVRGDMFVLDHESVHAMVDLGAISPTDWKLLTNAARKDKEVWASIQRRYPHLNEEGQLEEAVADLFASYQAAGDTLGRGGRTVVRILRNALKVLRAISQVLRGKKMTWRSSGNVMDDMAAGRTAKDIGRYPRQDKYSVEPAMVRYSIPERGEAIILAGREPTWKGKMADAFDRFRWAAQDRYLPLLKVQRDIELRTGAALPAEANPYIGEELMSGRIGARLEDLMENQVRPLFDAMADEKITQEELETYLYARHAPERNARIYSINPEFEEGSGSGMTDIEARAVMVRIERAGQTEAMERLAERVDRMRDQAVDYRVETGLMSQEQADQWRASYDFYVPLRGFAETDGDAEAAERINRSGGGINVRGKEARAAYGRRSQADSPLAYTILQAEEAIVRGETNRVAQRFIRLAQANPDDTFWEVNKVTSKPAIDEATGLVEYRNINQLLAGDADWTVSAKFEGKETRVTMNRADNEARALADAMRNLTQHQLDFITQYVGKVNRFLSSVNTSYNPEFIISNAFRDIQTAAFNLSAEEQDGLVKNTMKDYRKALVASTKGAFGRGEGEWARWYKEFTDEGGRVFFNRVEDVGMLKKRMERTAEQIAAERGEASTRLQAKRFLMAAKDMVENINLGVENAVRLAAYKNSRESGMSKEDAASLAKNLTVNFNRRGTMGPAMNAAYLFFNASVQGSVRILQAVRSKRVQKMMAGVVVTAAMIEAMNAMVSGDDDDGESYYDKIPHYEKSRNLIIMLPDGEHYVKVPLPYGYNAFYEAGRSSMEVARRGGRRWKESAGGFITTVVDSFNPVGGTDSLLNFVSPTIIDPIVDLTLNKDFTGRPIMPEQNPFDSAEPDHRRYFGSVAPHWRAITDFLNTASGGDDIEAGAVSVSPETLEYLAGTVVGAAGAFVDRTAAVPGKLADPDFDFSTSDVPFARKVVGDPPRWFDKGAYYDRVGAIDKALDHTKDYLDKEMPEEALVYVEKHAAVLSLEPVMKASQREMRAIRKARKANEGQKELGKIDDSTYLAEKRIIDQAEEQVITQFNTAWVSSVEKGQEYAGQ